MKKYLTLNIGAANLELAEYEAEGSGSLKLLNFGVAKLDASLDGGDVATILTPALLSLVREKGFKPGKVALSVSGQMVFSRFAAIPAVGGDDHFEQMVRYEIEQNVPFPIDEMICDRQILGDTESGDKSVGIVAAKTEQIEAITNAVRSAGFTPEIVSVAPIALTNAVSYLRGTDDSCSIVLDIGAKTTSLVIIEGEKVYNRSIPIAGNAITKEISNTLGCSLDEADELKTTRAYVSQGGVTEDEDESIEAAAKACRTVLTRIHAEISRSINFYRSQQHGSAPTRLYLTGGSALLPQADEFFNESLGIEVEFFNPFADLTMGPKVDTNALDTAGAMLPATLGLAIQANKTSRFTINLLPPALISERNEQAKIPYLIAGGLALVIGLVLVYLSINTETAGINERYEAIDGRVAELNRFDKKVDTARKDLESALADAEDIRARLASRALAVKRINAVRESLLPGMWIDRWDKNRIVIRYWKDRVTGTGKKTATEVVADRIKAKNTIFDPEGVKIAGTIARGSEGEIDEVTVEVQYK